MANLVPTPPTPAMPATPPTLTQRIDNELRRAAQAQLRAYNAIRLALYGPANHPFDEARVTANVTAWAMDTTTGMTYQQLQQAAQLAKASLNQFQDNVVVDSVHPATISF